MGVAVVISKETSNSSNSSEKLITKLTDHKLDQINAAMDEVMEEIIGCSTPETAKKIFIHLCTFKFDEKNHLPVIQKYLKEMRPKKTQTNQNNQNASLAQILSLRESHHRAAKNIQKPITQENAPVITADDVLKALLGNLSQEDAKKVIKGKLLTMAVFNLLLLLKKPQSSSYLPWLFEEYNSIAEEKASLESEKSSLPLEEYKKKTANLQQKENKYLASMQASIDECINKVVLPKLKSYNPDEDASHLKKALQVNNELLIKQKEELQEISKQKELLEQKLQQLQNEQSKNSFEGIISKLQDDIRSYQVKISTSNLKEETQTKKIKDLDNTNQSLQNQIKQLKDDEKLHKEKINALEIELSNIPEQTILYSDDSNNSLESPKRRKRNSTKPTVGHIATDLVLFLLNNFNINIKDSPLKELDRPKFNLATTFTRYNQTSQTNKNPLKSNELLEKIVWFLKRQFNNDNLNVTTNDGWTLLQIAAYFGDTSTADKLTTNLADPTLQNSDNHDALSLAVFAGHEDNKLIENLVNSTAKSHHYSWVFATKKKYTYENSKLSLVDLIVKKGRSKFLELLIEHLSLNQTAYNQYISHAIIEKDTKLLTILLKDIERKQLDGFLSQFTFVANDLETLKILLYYGALLTPFSIPKFIADKDIITSNLHFAAAINDSELCKKLLKDKKIISENNVTNSFYIALAKVHINIATQLIECIEALNYSINFDYVSKIIMSNENNAKELLEVFINRKILDSLNSEEIQTFITTLRNLPNWNEIAKILHNNTHFVQFLNMSYINNIKHGILNNVPEEEIAKFITSDLLTTLKTPSYPESSIFILAVTNNKIKVIQKLLSIGMNPNELSSDCETPLHIAIDKGFCDMARLLLRFKANPYALTLRGTPLLYALEKKNIEAIEILINPNNYAQEDTHYHPLSEIKKSIHHCLDTAIKQRKNDYIELLINCCQKDLKTSSLLKEVLDAKLLNILVARNEIKIIERLLPFSLNWLSLSEHKINSLDLAYYVGDAALLTMLKKHCYSIQHTVPPIYDKNENDFLSALDNGDISKVEEFISKDTFSVDHYFKSRNMTPLMIAALRGHTKLVDTLLKLRANTEQKNIHNLTALDFANIGDHLEIKTALSQQNTNNDLLNDEFFNLNVQSSVDSSFSNSNSSSGINYWDFFSIPPSPDSPPSASPKRKAPEQTEQNNDDLKRTKKFP